MGSPNPEKKSVRVMFSEIPPKAKWLVYLTSFSAVGFGYFFIAVSSYLPEVGVSGSEIGLILASSGAASILTAIPMGIYADRHGRKLLFILGLFLFPMAVLTTAVGKDIALLRPDYIIAPILKAPLSYLVVVALLVAAALLQSKTKHFENAAIAVTAADLALNLAVQVIAIIAMRSIGLFFRHYSCYLKW